MRINYIKREKLVISDLWFKIRGIAQSFMISDVNV